MNEKKSLQPGVLLKQKIALILFGLFLFFVLLEVSLRLGGFILLSIQEHRNLQSIQQKGAYRILCLGESTTAGQYPQFLEVALNQRNIGVRFSVIDKGRACTYTSIILSKVESYLDEYHPGMVVTMMGVNDAGDFIPYEVATTSKTILLFKSLKIYKLARLLWLHILAKAEVSVESTPTKNAFEKTTELNPKNDKAYIELEGGYPENEEIHQAEAVLKKTTELYPKNDKAFIELGWVYHNQGKFLQAQDAFKKAIEVNPKNYKAYTQLGWFYRFQDKLYLAEDPFKKAIELNSQNDYLHFELGRLYLEQGKFPQAQDAFKKAIELNPKNYNAYGAMSVLCAELGKPELAKYYTIKAKMLRLEYCTPGTVNNYRKLKEILDKRGIRLVCVQYPMRNVEPLKKIFEQNKGIIFVDNESIFREALKKASYKEYFVDMFGGDFGHCTEKGNRLLAQNIADVILEEVFKCK